jgi:adenylate kinase
MWTRRLFFSTAAALLCFGAADQRFIIVLIGPTGAGKTTQSEFLKQGFGIPTIAADDLARENPAALAKYREPGIDPGTPATSPALNDLVAGRLSKMDLTKGVVLDGYPATKDQADHLTVLVKKLNLPSPVIIHLQVPDNVARERLRQRKRDDDTPEQIERRLADYHRELEMLSAYYPKANIWTIDGTKPITEVSDTIRSILTDEIPKRQ